MTAGGFGSAKIDEGACMHSLQVSLHPQVVGGLCWCITSSGADIDVDILFQVCEEENEEVGLLWGF